MTAEEFLALWLVLTITVGYLGLVALWCLLATSLHPLGYEAGP